MEAGSAADDNASDKLFGERCETAVRRLQPKVEQTAQQHCLV